MNDVVFRNYTRMMTRAKKLYFRGFPFPVPIIETAIAFGTMYLYWKYLMGLIPTWIPVIGTNPLIQLLLGFALAAGGFLLVKVRTSDNRPLLYGVLGFVRSRTGKKVYNPRTGKSAARKTYAIQEKELSRG